jgi:hypothetical protein
MILPRGVQAWRRVAAWVRSCPPPSLTRGRGRAGTGSRPAVHHPHHPPPRPRLRKNSFFFLKQVDFFGFFMYVLYSTLLHLPPLTFHCVQGSNPGQLRLWHRLPDALATRLHLIHNSATSHPHSATSRPHSATSHPHSTTYISSTTRLHLIHK